jgi:hypothetical protein
MTAKGTLLLQLIRCAHKISQSDDGFWLANSELFHDMNRTRQKGCHWGNPIAVDCGRNIRDGPTMFYHLLRTSGSGNYLAEGPQVVCVATWGA